MYKIQESRQTDTRDHTLPLRNELRRWVNTSEVQQDPKMLEYANVEQKESNGGETYFALCLAAAREYGNALDYVDARPGWTHARECAGGVPSASLCLLVATHHWQLSTARCLVRPR